MLNPVQIWSTPFYRIQFVCIACPKNRTCYGSRLVLNPMLLHFCIFIRVVALGRKTGPFVKKQAAFTLFGAEPYIVWNEFYVSGG